MWGADITATIGRSSKVMNMNEATPERPPERETTRGLRRELVTLVGIAVVSLSLALFLRLCVAQAYEIRGQSMRPTLFDGDRVILLKIAPTILPISADDIVIFSHPSDPGRDLVKRVVARGGDTVRLNKGRVYVNGRLSAYSMATRPHGRERWWTIPEGSYFVLGDNRINSLDSRDFGPVTHDLVKGKVWFRWWPIRSSDEY